MRQYLGRTEHHRLNGSNLFISTGQVKIISKNLFFFVFVFLFSAVGNDVNERVTEGNYTGLGDGTLGPKHRYFAPLREGTLQSCK